MLRPRSASDSHFSTGTRSKLHSTTSYVDAPGQTNPSRNCSRSYKTDKDSSRYALTLVLQDYKYVGKIVMLKPEDEYGFLKSEQISSDVFFSLHYTTGFIKPNLDSMGKFVSFAVKDVGRKSMEARKVKLWDSEPSMEYLVGMLDRWVKTGVLIQVTSGIGQDPEYSHNRIFAPFSECTSFSNSLVNVEVKFRIHMDKSLRVEARDVKLTKPEIQSQPSSPPSNTSINETLSTSLQEKLMIKDLTNGDLSEELIKNVDGMSPEMLKKFFDTSLKTRLADFSQQPVASKVIIAVIKKISEIGCHKIEENITRMIVANFLMISSCKQGCLVVQAALENFSEAKRLIIAEQLAELATLEEFIDLWTHAGHVFITMLDYLDEYTLTMIGSILSGNYMSLSCNICHYKPVRSLLTHLVKYEFFSEVFSELQENIEALSCDKFGHYVVNGILETAHESVKSVIIETFSGKIVRLSLDPVCHSVIVTAIKEGNSNQQSDIIEEVCRVTSKQAEMDIIQLAQDRYGHKVVLAMLSGTRHKHIHNILKASILCKQEELLQNEFAARVFKAIKTEFHNKVTGNYPKSH